MVLRGALLMALWGCGSLVSTTQYSVNTDNQKFLSRVEDKMLEIDQYSTPNQMIDDYMKAETRFQTAKNLLLSGSAQNPAEKILIFRNLQQSERLLASFEIADTAFDENFNLVLLEDDAELELEIDQVATSLAAPAREPDLKSELEMAFATSEMELEILKNNYQLRIAGLSDSTQKDLSLEDKNNLRKLASSLNGHSFRSVEIEFSYLDEEMRESALKRAQMAKIYLESYLAIDEPVVSISSLGPKNIGNGIQFKIFTP